VHPNTVAYRLRRVRELTGLDARVPTDAALLVIALKARGGTAR
jgi:DNA-binding PucR family transcriptional regulator